MDFQIPLIFGSVFSLASVVLIFIFKFGIKEKSYEEALAEQRQQNHTLLGVKVKPKDKKSKKTSKKSKEKLCTDGEGVEELLEAPPIENSPESAKKAHVEFKEVQEEIFVEREDAVVSAVKKPAKKEKIRPILVNKETFEISAKKVNDSAVSNHFEELHPKDEFELLRSVAVPLQSEESVKEGNEKKKGAKVNKVTNDVQKQPETKKKDKEVKKQLEKIETVAVKETIVPPAASAAVAVNGILGNTGKEKKKKKSEYNTLQQLAGDTGGITFVLNLLRNAELTRSDVQILIDLLLNKQHEAPTISDDWSEGKYDPVQRLKKQLAEKEKLLLDEQQVVANTQAKFREIRAEYQSDKTALQQKIRNLDEICHSKQVETTRLHQQLQQLQAQLNEQVIENHKLRDDFNTIQIQRQQFEIRVAQAQDSEAILAQVQNENQELSASFNQLRMEYAHLSEESCAEKERIQGLIVQLNNFQQESEQKTELIRQLEDARLNAEHSLDNIMKNEDESKAEINRLMNILQQQKEDWNKRLELIKSQTQEELQRQEDEHRKLISQLKSQLKALQDENSNLKTTHEKNSLEENKQNVDEILNLHEELSSLKTELQKTQERTRGELTSANTLVKNLQQETADLKAQLAVEQSKVELQLQKNNELRVKNWKVMEALQVAESRTQNKVANVQIKSSRDIEREFILRLFPDANLSDVEPDVYIKEHIDSLAKLSKQNTSGTDDVQQLKSQLQHYKDVLDNADKMLNKLQKHIEQEEINWRRQLAEKTAELNMLKESIAVDLQQKVSFLETELKEVRDDKSKIFLELQCLRNGTTDHLKKVDTHNCNSANGVH